tara:strand:+ start:1014 stop:1880 length:867 start_codon:yes stop_codon:yes gene_type:complete
METVNCIICDSDMNVPFIKISDRFSSKVFQVVKCKCNFKYLSPRPEFSEMDSYYKNDNYEPHRAQIKSFFDTLYRWVQKYSLKWKYAHISKFIKSGSLLDIGGGGGEFCSYYQSKGWEVSLQDSNKKARSSAESNSITTFASLSKIKNKQFDLITLWHSLEHIHEIKKLFTEINKLINTDGLLVIAVPNQGAPERKWFKGQWAPWDAPRHLYHFNYEQLSILLLKYGWTVQYSKTMLQDTPYNILLSLKSKSVMQMTRAAFILIYSMIRILIGGVKSSSSFMVICQKN